MNDGINTMPGPSIHHRIAVAASGIPLMIALLIHIMPALCSAAPVAEPPVAEPPVAESPVAESPVAESSVAESPVAASPATASRPATPLPPEVSKAIRDRVRNNFNPSFMIALVTPDGVTYSAHGVTSFETRVAPDENTIYEIGSISKVFTATLLSDMIIRKETTLETPATALLPAACTLPQYEGKPLRLVDLATQTSGLPRMPGNFEPADPLNPYADYTTEHLYEFLASHELRRGPGEYEYSNLGYGLLGHALAHRLRMPYEAAIIERITDVIGMPDTRVTLSEQQRSRLARPHRGNVEVSGWDLPTFAGAGALRSTARDMAAFLAANMGHGEPRSPLYPALGRTHLPRQDVGPNLRIGLGWHIRTTPTRSLVWHNGGTGGYRSFCGFRADGSLGVVLLTNSSTPADDIAFHLLDADLPLNSDRFAVRRVDANLLRKYVGNYRLAGDVSMRIDLRNGSLLCTLDDETLPHTLYAMANDAFRMMPRSVTIEFQKGQDGRIKGVIFKEGKSMKLGTRIIDESEKPKRPWADRPEITLTPDQLEPFVGKYEISPDSVFEIKLPGKYLQVKFGDQSFLPVFPESELEFFYKAVDAQLTFKKDESGEIVGLTVHQGGADAYARKVE